MARVALRVRVEVGGNRERHAAPCRLMTSRAICPRADVLLMVKGDTKTAEAGKALERRARIAQIVDVANRAHRYVGAGELGHVATVAGLVSGKSRLRCRAITRVTRGAIRRVTEICVRARTRVRKF